MLDPSTRGRPRRAETDVRVLRAASELLREKGPAGVNIDAVAARSGVARTTIYRRFESRRELLAAVVDPVVERPLPPAGLPLAGKVRWVLDQAVDVVEMGLGRGTVAAIMSNSDPEFTTALRNGLGLQLDALMAEIASDIDAGAVADIEPDAVVGVLLGAYLAEILRHGEPRPGWAHDTVTLLTRALQVTH